MCIRDSSCQRLWHKVKPAFRNSIHLFLLCSCLQILSGVRTLVAVLRVLRWHHLRYDCMYSRPQLYLQLFHLERTPDTDDGLYSVFRAVRCSSFNPPDLRPAACLRAINETLGRTGFDVPFRNTCQLVSTTCAYLRVLSRFVRCCRNIFAYVGK